MVVITGDCVDRFMGSRGASCPTFLCGKEAGSFAESEDVESRGGFQRFEICSSPCGNWERVLTQNKWGFQRATGAQWRLKSSTEFPCLLS